MSKQNRKFEGVWIEKEVWLSRALTLQEKAFFVEIKSLDNESGCFAGNEYFADFFQLSKRRCISVINSLVEKGLVRKRLVYKKGTKQVEKRVLNVSKTWRKKLSTPGERNFTTPGERTDTPLVNISSLPSCGNVHHPGEGMFTDNSTVNSTSNSTIDIARAQNKITKEDLKDFEMLEKSIEQEWLKTPKKTPSKVAQKVPIEDQMLPNWMQVATDMAEYLKGDGSDQWGFLCEAAGGHVDPITITTAWAGKNCDASYPLKNWKKHIPKLTNWIRNELKSNSLHKKKEERYSAKSSTSERLKVKTNGLNRSEIKISKVPV